MDKRRHTPPITANIFHEGNTCPYCQEIIQAGHMIVICDDCGSIQHLSCKEHKGGCASYICDKNVHINSEHKPPELIITDTDLNSISTLSMPKRVSAKELTTQFMEGKPQKASWLAIASLLLTAISCSAVWGVIHSNVQILTAGFALAALSIITALLAMVLMNSRIKKYCFTFASLAVVISAFLLIAYIWSMHQISKLTYTDATYNLWLKDSMPNKEDIEQLETEKAMALKANVVIESKENSAFAGAVRYGSGIILKIEKHKAFILTNKHVVAPKTNSDSNINITFYNAEKSPAHIVWEAPDGIDLTVLSSQALTVDDDIGAVILPALLPQGAVVFAVGNPTGLPWTYTEGVISGIRHNNKHNHKFVIYQTQTPINTGNSGGGLYNTQGCLVGINTWIYDKSATEGINFAIAAKSLLELWTNDELLRFCKQTDVMISQDSKEQEKDR